MEDKYAKLKEILSDEESCKRLFVMDAAEVAVVLKEEYGLIFSAEELIDFMKGFQAALHDRENGELNETDLEMVSGGRRNADAYDSGYSFGRAIPAAVIVIAAGATAASW